MNTKILSNIYLRNGKVCDDSTAWDVNNCYVLQKQFFSYRCLKFYVIPQLDHTGSYWIIQSSYLYPVNPLKHSIYRNNIEIQFLPYRKHTKFLLWNPSGCHYSDIYQLLKTRNKTRKYSSWTKMHITFKCKASGTYIQYPKISRNILQSLQTKVRIPKSRQDCFLPSPYQFITHKSLNHPSLHRYDFLMPSLNKIQRNKISYDSNVAYILTSQVPANKVLHTFSASPINLLAPEFYI